MERAADPETAVTLFDEGRAETARGDLPRALDKLRQSVALSPSAASTAALGKCLLRLSHMHEAVVYLAASVGLRGGSHARTLLAQALLRMGDRDEALRHLRETLKEDPGSVGAVEQMRDLLSDPHVISRTANRHRLLEELRVAVPGFAFATARLPVRVFGALGQHVCAELAHGTSGEDLAPIFQFLNRLAISPDQEVVNLLEGAVFPHLARSPAAIEVARRMLVGKGREAFERSLALWGSAAPPPPAMTAASLWSELPVLIAGFPPHLQRLPLEAGETLGRCLVAEIDDGATDDEVAPVYDLLQRMAESDDGVVEAVLHAAIDPLIDSRRPKGVAAAKRLLTGQALELLDRKLGW